MVSFDLLGHTFMAISAGPLFTINPSISFMINFDPAHDSEAAQHLDILWNKLSDGGKILMPLGAYPFSQHYGWVQDKFGVSWQLILTNPAGEERPRIIPSLLFVGDVCGKAEEATNMYLSIFKDSHRGTLARYPAGMPLDKEGTVMFTDINLLGQWFVAMDSAANHAFRFNEAVSLIITCDTQEEIDYYWSKLSADPRAEQCGWLKDKFGVSWQVVPRMMSEIFKEHDEAALKRVTAAFLKMKKFDIEKIKKAQEGV
jgi:predicted 3-demethylubiquinone-9 3-methyltransferase (glyoxalase superfamily)